MLFRKEKVDELTRIYHILGLKFTRKKKPAPISKLTKARKDDALITLKCLRNLVSKMNTVETIVLGSSHARMGFVEDQKSINFGIDSQDLYYSYKLFEKYVDIIPNLKNMVLFYGIFSPGNDLENSPQSYRTAYYAAYFDIPYKNKYTALKSGVIELESKLFKFNKYIARKLPKIPHDLMTQEHKNINPTSLEKKWINRWLDLNKRNTQIIYLEKMLELAKNKQIKVLVITSPYNPRIKKDLPASSELFESMYKICKKYNNVEIYNAFDDSQYTEDDFIDMEHSSRSGAEKITAKIRIMLG